MKLWNRNFTIITLGTVISAISGTAMDIALSLVVFDNTASALSTALYLAISSLPQVILPLLLAPTIDRVRRAPLIPALDFASAALFLGFGGFAFARGFSYGAYLLLGVLSGCLNAVYNMAYGALYPDLIPAGQLEKGYAVSAMIYPTVTVVMSPVAAVIYAAVGVEWLLLGEGAALLIAAAFECFIRVKEEPRANEKRSLRSFVSDWRAGLDYLKKEKGIRSLYGYMAVTNATGSANGLMVLAAFQSSPVLSTAMYSLLISAETVGRAVGGLAHYFTDIAPEKKARMIERIYYIYEGCDAALLFLPWGCMLAAKFLCGFLGVNSATLRQTAVQRHLPPDIRARVNSLLEVACSLGYVVVQLIAGVLGDLLPYRLVTVLLAGCAMLTCFLLVSRNRREIGRLYTEPAAVEQQSALAE